MSDIWQQLPWDSEFFGISIGRINLDGADDAAIAAAETDARAHGVACLYGSLDPADASATLRVQEVGYRFVEAATTFRLDLEEPPIARPPDVTVRLGTEADLPDLADAVDKIAPWSRFAVDPGFGLDAARRLQAAWVERAATCTTGAYSLVVAEEASRVVAFITRAAEPEPIVDLVATTAPGSGAARYLIEDARSWAGDRPLLGGPIAARNIRSLRYVSHCGYRIHGVRYLYHRWLDHDPGAPG